MKEFEAHYMKKAIEAAQQANTPFGALLLAPNTGQQAVMANSVAQDKDPSAHAEMNVLRAAGQKGMETQGSILFSTCEPCPMCAMAVVWAGVAKVYFGASIDDAARYGNQVKIYCRDIAEAAWYDLEVEGGILHAACLELFAASKA